MIKVRIKLDSPERLTELNAAAAAMPFDIDVSSGWYVADAKSLVGLFGLKLSKPIRVNIYTDRCNAQPFLDSIQAMLV
ncbi:MAG: HPr family phosphocarrier protein [Eubacteriales bacterium]|nr:HPr family phosphocarrier protein [Eubacteriales bacterium]